MQNGQQEERRREGRDSDGQKQRRRKGERRKWGGRADHGQGFGREFDVLTERVTILLTV